MLYEEEISVMLEIPYSNFHEDIQASLSFIREKANFAYNTD